jgi:hypothetical protein
VDGGVTVCADGYRAPDTVSTASRRCPYAPRDAGARSWQRSTDHRRIVERSSARSAQNLQGLRSKEEPMDLIWIIVIVLIVLALLGYFGRGRFR